MRGLLEVQSRVIHEDKRGLFVEMFKGIEMENPVLGQVSIMRANAGEVRGGHFHKRKTEWFALVDGKGKLVVEDVETGERESLDMGKYEVVKIRAGLLHYVEAETDLIMLIYCDEPFFEEDSDTYRK